MTAHAKISRAGKSGVSGAFIKRSVSGRAVFVPAKAMDESLEDARLNAIADERANGPFVQVSLDDL